MVAIKTGESVHRNHHPAGGAAITADVPRERAPIARILVDVSVPGCFDPTRATSFGPTPACARWATELAPSWTLRPPGFFEVIHRWNQMYPLWWGQFSLLKTVSPITRSTSIITFREHGGLCGTPVEIRSTTVFSQVNGVDARSVPEFRINLRVATLTAVQLGSLGCQCASGSLAMPLAAMGEYCNAPGETKRGDHPVTAKLARYIVGPAKATGKED